MVEGVKPGARFRSVTSDTEVIVIKAPEESVDLRCGGHPMVVLDGTVRDMLDPTPEFAGATLIGKRYADETEVLEVLCTKGGSCTLSLGCTPLRMKEPKPLPSSD